MGGSVRSTPEPARGYTSLPSVNNSYTASSSLGVSLGPSLSKFVHCTVYNIAVVSAAEHLRRAGRSRGVDGRRSHVGAGERQRSDVGQVPSVSTQQHQPAPSQRQRTAHHVRITPCYTFFSVRCIRLWPAVADLPPSADTALQ